MDSNGQKKVSVPRWRPPSWMVGAGFGAAVYVLLCVGVMSLHLKMATMPIILGIANPESKTVCETVIEGTDAERTLLYFEAGLVLPGFLVTALLSSIGIREPFYSFIFIFVPGIPFVGFAAILASKAIPKVIAVGVTIGYAILATAAGLCFGVMLALGCYG